ncbi:MAG: lipocalin-like domain-containing protein [Candidatus Eremiobacteraeota bacterium]|nr:lipocalin-like domain-containing protein [Candidatus Eremiobacteraeota bacterium]
MELRAPVISRGRILTSAASAGLIATFALPARAAQPSVIGAWTLESFDQLENGVMKPRFGPHPVGYLIYTASGRVSATLSAAHRPKLIAPDASTSTVEERADALRNFLAYAGRYEVRGNRVFHKVETCIWTNLVGTTLERAFEISGDTLTIRTLPPEIWGNANTLVWRRA